MLVVTKPCRDNPVTVDLNGKASVMTRYRIALWAFVGFFVASLGLTGCNTVRGVGQDVEAAGAGVAGTAEDVQKDMRRRN